jgi:hypothetical protein
MIQPLEERRQSAGSASTLDGMGRGKRQRIGASSQTPLTLGEPGTGSRPTQVLPKNLIKSLKPALVKTPRLPKEPPVVAVDGTLSPIGHAVLAALDAQSAAQVRRKDWNRLKVPNGAFNLPDGISESKYRKTLTELRRVGYVNNRDGMWWVCTEGRVQLDLKLLNP